MYYVGRALQFFGLILVPFALYYGLKGGAARGVAQRELMMLAAGALAFWLGRGIEGKYGGS